MEYDFNYDKDELQIIVIFSREEMEFIKKNHSHWLYNMNPDNKFSHVLEAAGYAAQIIENEEEKQLKLMNELPRELDSDA